jgi:fluoride exporter
MFKYLLLVFTGGGIGSLFRFGMSKAFNPVFQNFPLGTFLSNLTASLIVGFIVGLPFIQNNNSDFYKYFIVLGICGGFSTFSGFSHETYALIKQDNYQYAVLNIATNVILCLVAIIIGIKLGKWVQS